MRYSTFVKSVVFVFILIGCNNTEENNSLKPFVITEREKLKIDSLIAKTPFPIEDITFHVFQRRVLKNEKVEVQKIVIVKYKNTNAEVLKKQKFVQTFCKNLRVIIGNRLKDSLNYTRIITEIEISKSGFINTQKGVMTVGYGFDK